MAVNKDGFEPGHQLTAAEYSAHKIKERRNARQNKQAAPKRTRKASVDNSGEHPAAAE